jgi:hypothetical protein
MPISDGSVRKRAFKSFTPICSIIFTAVATLVLHSVAFSQSSDVPTGDLQQHHHSMMTEDTIDGAMHPEMVHEVTAYRLFLFMVGEEQEPTLERWNQQQAILSPIGLTDSEKDLVISLADQFKHDFMQQIAQYSVAVNIANKNHVAPDLQGFKRRRDALVESITNDNVTDTW